MLSDFRQGVSPAEHRVLDKAMALSDALALRPETLADELRLEFEAVVEDVAAERLTESTLVRAAALFIVMLQQMMAREAVTVIDEISDMTPAQVEFCSAFTQVGPIEQVAP
jgi:hypothetical protein